MDRIPEELEAELRSLLRIHLVFEGSHVPAFSERDVFLLSFQVPGRETRPVELWARMVESLERGIVVSGVSQAMPVPLWDQLERAKERVFSNAMATVYRAFEPHHDLYSLGLLLVRLLLVNQTRSLDALSQPLDEVVTGLDPLVRGLDPDDSDTLLGRIEERLSAEGEVFQPSSVVFDPRAPRSGEAPVPGYLWYEALTIALRFLSDVPGFGFWSRASRPGSTKPLAEALRTIDTLRNRIQVELFGERRRSREIGMICAEMRSELTAKPR